MVLGIALMPIILKKGLKEIKLISIILYIAIITFILTLLIQVFTLGETYNPD